MCTLYLPMKRYPVCITSTPTAYAAIDTTIIHHVYKLDFSSMRVYFLDRKLEPVCHLIGGRVRSSFLLGQWSERCVLVIKNRALSAPASILACFGCSNADIKRSKPTCYNHVDIVGLMWSRLFLFEHLQRCQKPQPNFRPNKSVLCSAAILRKI